jgi:hypothetical protein
MFQTLRRAAIFFANFIVRTGSWEPEELINCRKGLSVEVGFFWLGEACGLLARELYYINL